MRDGIHKLLASRNRDGEMRGYQQNHHALFRCGDLGPYSKRTPNGIGGRRAQAKAIWQFCAEAGDANCTAFVLFAGALVFRRRLCFWRVAPDIRPLPALPLTSALGRGATSTMACARAVMPVRSSGL